MRIFVTCGTGSFSLLFKTLDNLITSGEIKDDIIAQIGHSEYTPKQYEWFRFKDIKVIDEIRKKVDIIIGHFGLATVYEAIKANKKFIGVVNFTRLDFHQGDLARKMSSDGYVLWCTSLDDLPIFIKKAESWRPKKYAPPECSIAREVINFMENTGRDGDVIRKFENNRGPAERAAV